MSCTVTIAGLDFTLTAEQLAYLVAATKSGRARAMLVGCDRCRGNRHQDPPPNEICIEAGSGEHRLLCGCCQNYHLMRVHRPGGRPFPNASDLGEHRRAPLRETMATLTRTEEPAALGGRTKGHD